MVRTNNKPAVVVYKELLAMAHQRGLRSIRTEIVQIPSEANNRVAVCFATITLEDNGIERVFTGVGDANPANVAPTMVHCILRLAETRAKARALRDAVNIGDVAVEEMAQYDEAEPQTYQAPRSARNDVDLTAPITANQQSAITNLCKRTGADPDQLARQAHGVSLDNLSRGQAAEIIKGLNAPRAAAQ